MDMKKLIVTMLVFAMLFVAPIASFAETTETVAVTTAQDENVANSISETYNMTVTSQEIADLHAASLGYGEISTAYGISSLSGVTVSELLGMRAAMGWGEIAATYGVKVSDVNRNTHAVENSLKNMEKENNRASNQKGLNAGNSNNSNAGGNGGGNGNGNGGGGGGGNGDGNGGGNGGGKK